MEPPRSGGSPLRADHPSVQPEAAPWWTRAVVYQIYPRSFADSDGDGVGDLRGVIDHLDHLEDLGIDVVWLSPVYRSPQRDAGYDISDYCDIDPAFGTLADLDELIAALHLRGMKLMMDLVVNHTSDEHPWFIESRSSRDSPKRDWYWWRPPRNGRRGDAPNNWGSVFSGSAWTWDAPTGEYYLHLFAQQQPDLNWENPEVRTAVYDMMRWWLDRGVDGFRMDVINMISKDASLPDGGVAPGTTLPAGSEHYVSGPRVHEFVHEMHEAVFAGREDALITVGEANGVTVEEAQLFTAPERREIDMVFQFEHMNVDRSGGRWYRIPLDLVALKQTFARWQNGLSRTGWNSLYWNNHDQPRVVSRFGDDGVHREVAATALATVLHLQRGTPYVYQGEELGMTNLHGLGREDLRDVQSINYLEAAVAAGSTVAEAMALIAPSARDNARTPMQWDATENAGFTAGTPWMRINPNHAAINARSQRGDLNSVFSYYRRLIALRHDDDTVALGDFTLLLPDDPHLFAFTRSLGGNCLLAVANLSGMGGVEVPLDDAALWTACPLVLANQPVEPGAALTLRPWEARVYRRTGGSG